MAVQWYYQELGQILGPVPSEQLRKLAAQGTIVPWTPVRRVLGSDLSPWTRAGEIKKLFDGDVSEQLGKPICEDCGTVLDEDNCPNCSPLDPIQGEDGSSFFPPVAPHASTPRHSPIRVEKRYPNLRKYLEWMKSLARIALYLTWGMMAIAVAALLMDSRGSSGAAESFVSVLFAASVLGLLAYVLYVCFLAGVEFIQVVIDIEENTRSLDVNSQQG